MTVEPKVQALIDTLDASFPPLDPTVSGAVTRQRARAARQGVVSPSGEPVAEVRDDVIPGPAGPIPVRIYRPLDTSAASAPTVMFFHGGGWILCDLDSHDGICRSLANASGCLVVSVDYRLAPEHPFPSGLDDCYAATAWWADHGADYGADPEHLAIAGDSAGGNLAAAVCLMARDRGGPRLDMQVLVYPVIDYSDATGSHRSNAEGFFLTSAYVMYYWREYLSDPANGTHPYASPLRAETHRGLPPAVILTAEHDPLRDEGEAYAAALRAAGVPVRSHCYLGMFHGFLGFTAVLEAAADAMSEIGQSLRQVFSPHAPAEDASASETVGG